MSYEVLARKYRPTNFEEVVGQDHVIKALVNSIEQEKIHQAYIFSGTRGVGKTSIARILAKCMNCENDSKPTPKPCNQCSNTQEISSGRSVDFLEIDAASNTGVDKIRDLVSTVEYKPAKGRFKVYLIDEVHMLSTPSFNALLKTLEEPPPHVIFILATTNPDEIPKTVQSRCLQLSLKTVNKEMLFNHFKNILKKEKIKYDEDSISLIANSANGSVRDGLTLLDQAIANGKGELNNQDVKKLLGTIDNFLLLDLIENIVDGKGPEAFDILSKIEELLPEYDSILRDIIAILHQISLEHFLQNTKNDRIKNIADVIDKEFCQLLYEIALNAYSKFSVHPNPKEALEICILRMLAFNPVQKLSSTEIKKQNPVEKKNKIESKTQSLNDNKTPKELRNNKEWLAVFDSLTISPFTRNYFGNMSFDYYDGSILNLIADKDMSQVPESIMLEFKDSLKQVLLCEVEIKIQAGKSNNSPIEIKEKNNQMKEDIAKTDISSDKDIQSFINKFDGKIKLNTIKPLE